MELGMHNQPCTNEKTENFNLYALSLGLWHIAIVQQEYEIGKITTCQ